MAFWDILVHSCCPQTQRNLYLPPNKQHQVGRRSAHVKKAMMGWSLGLFKLFPYNCLSAASVSLSFCVCKLRIELLRCAIR